MTDGKSVDTSVLRLYAILNKNLEMAPGKAIAQAGHAFTDVVLHGLETGCAHTAAYARLRPGTKVTLGADERLFERLMAQANELGVPVVKVIDSGHVHPPHFDGSPKWTAIGLGPVSRDVRFPLLKRLSLWNPVQYSPSKKGDLS